MSKHVQQVKLMEALREVGNLPRPSTSTSITVNRRITPDLVARWGGHGTHHAL